MSEQGSSYLAAVITAVGAVVLTAWKTTTHFLSTRATQRADVDRQRIDDLRAIITSDLDFATGLRNELREDVTRMKGQMSEIISENLALRREVSSISREKHTLRNELALVKWRVVQLEGALSAAGIAVPTNPFTVAEGAP